MSSRISHHIIHGVRTFLPAGINMLSPLLLLGSGGMALWGQYIQVFIFINLFSQISFWGHRDPFIRDASEKPKDTYSIWAESIYVRSFFLIIPLAYFYYSLDAPLFRFVITICVLSFIIQSIQSLYIFQRRFTLLLIGEGVGAMFFLLYLLYFNKEMGLDTLWQASTLQVVSTVSIFLFGFSYSKIKRPKQSLVQAFSFLKSCFPFLLIGLGGYLNSRIDFFVLSGEKYSMVLGEYHVVKNYLLYATVMASMITTPILKYLYRLSKKSFVKLFRKMMTYAALLSLLLSLSLPFIFTYFYSISVSWLFVVCIWLFVGSSFFKMTLIIWLYRNKKEYWVLGGSFVGAGLHVLFLYLIPNDHDFERILFVICVSKIVLGVIYLAFLRITENTNDFSPENLSRVK